MKMGKFKFIKTEFPDLYVIEHTKFHDERGFFMEYYNLNDFQAAGLDVTFVQDNYSRSYKGVLRGMHFQKEHPQGKLVWVTHGAMFDAVIDLRKASPTFSKWFGIELSEENKKMLYIPPGFAQGFLILSDPTDLMYKCTDLYHPEEEGGLIWDDPTIGIKWPLVKVGKNLILSKKDQTWPRFENLDFYFDFK